MAFNIHHIRHFKKFLENMAVTNLKIGLRSEIDKSGFSTNILFNQCFAPFGSFLDGVEGSDLDLFFDEWDHQYLYKGSYPNCIYFCYPLFFVPRFEGRRNSWYLRPLVKIFKEILPMDYEAAKTHLLSNYGLKAGGFKGDLKGYCITSTKNMILRVHAFSDEGVEKEIIAEFIF